MRLKANYHVTVGTDMINQVIITTDRAESFAMPWAMFKAFFEPSNDDEKELMIALERRCNPPPYGFEVVKDDDGNMVGMKQTGKPPGL